MGQVHTGVNVIKSFCFATKKLGCLSLASVFRLIQNVWVWLEPTREELVILHNLG
jgi:hypothetical protein